MYDVLDKETIKFEILPHLSVVKRSYISKMIYWRSSNVSSISSNQARTATCTASPQCSRNSWESSMPRHIHIRILSQCRCRIWLLKVQLYGSGARDVPKRGYTLKEREKGRWRFLRWTTLRAKVSYWENECMDGFHTEACWTGLTPNWPIG